MFMKLYDDGGPAEDVYAATVLNDHGLWDGCELLHLPTRISVRATKERSFTLNLKEARGELRQKVAEGETRHGRF